MAEQYTSVIVKATYIDRLQQWSADEGQVFQGEDFTEKEVVQIDISIWTIVCLSVLITTSALFMSQ